MYEYVIQLSFLKAGSLPNKGYFTLYQVKPEYNLASLSQTSRPCKRVKLSLNKTYLKPIKKLLLNR